MAVPAGFEQAGAVGAEPDRGGRPVGPTARPEHGAVSDRVGRGAVAADEYRVPVRVDDQPGRPCERRLCYLLAEADDDLTRAARSVGLQTAASLSENRPSSSSANTLTATSA